jgi:hypothetical protein
VTWIDLSLPINQDVLEALEREVTTSDYQEQRIYQSAMACATRSCWPGPLEHIRLRVVARSMAYYRR